MQKLEALSQCLLHWEYLRDNKLDVYDKRDYFMSRGVRVPMMGCYACEYERGVAPDIPNHQYRKCDLCPLTGYAWKLTEKSYHCEADPDSLYQLWVDSDNNKADLYKYADAMVQAIKQAIKEYNDLK